MPIRWHEEDPVLFLDAITYTASRTGFLPRLLEKDYFCSVVLEYLATAGDTGLVFKGGTCLSKIHSGFFRLSEDLDFIIPVAEGTSRKERSRLGRVVKATLDGLVGTVPALSIVQPWVGANNSIQYTAIMGYTSLLDGHLEPISIEVGLRESLLTESVSGTANTALLNPLNGQPLQTAFQITALSWHEAMAEKLRAALCRREVAIRDYFDLDHAVHHLGLDLTEGAFMDLLQRKLTIPGNGPVDISSARIAQLKVQLSAQLRPVLEESAYNNFNLDRAVQTVSLAAQRLGAVCAPSHYNEDGSA